MDGQVTNPRFQRMTGIHSTVTTLVWLVLHSSKSQERHHVWTGGAWRNFGIHHFHFYFVHGSTSSGQANTRTSKTAFSGGHLLESATKSWRNIVHFYLGNLSMGFVKVRWLNPATWKRRSLIREPTVLYILGKNIGRQHALLPSARHALVSSKIGDYAKIGKCNL